MPDIIDKIQQTMFNQEYLQTIEKDTPDAVITKAVPMLTAAVLWLPGLRTAINQFTYPDLLTGEDSTTTHQRVRNGLLKDFGSFVKRMDELSDSVDCVIGRTITADTGSIRDPYSFSHTIVESQVGLSAIMGSNPTFLIGTRLDPNAGAVWFNDFRQLNNITILPAEATTS